MHPKDIGNEIIVTEAEEDLLANENLTPNDDLANDDLGPNALLVPNDVLIPVLVPNDVSLPNAILIPNDVLVPIIEATINYVEPEVETTDSNETIEELIIVDEAKIDSTPLENELVPYLSPTSSKTSTSISTLSKSQRDEIDSINKDLLKLTMQVNSFMQSQELPNNNQSLGMYENPPINELDEKYDGPSEKELCTLEKVAQGDVKKELVVSKEIVCKEEIACKEEILEEDDIYLYDNVGQPHVNWNVVGPLIQQTVGDLQAVSTLNSKVGSMIRRIKNFTEQAQNQPNIDDTDISADLSDS